MLRTGMRVTSGPNSIFAAEALRKAENRRDSWPYEHVYPPIDSDRRNPQGFVVTPALYISPTTTNQALVLQFNVPSGFMFIMKGLLLAAVTTGMVPIGNPGDFQFSVDKNTPIGAAPTQGSPVTDLNAIPFNWGSPSQGPVMFARAEEFAPTDQVRAKVINFTGGVGAPNFVVASFYGYLYPSR